MNQNPIQKHLDQHCDFTEKERQAFTEGFKTGWEQGRKTIDRLREGLLMMSLEIYAQQLQRGNSGIREAVNDLVHILEDTKYD